MRLNKTVIQFQLPKYPYINDIRVLRIKVIANAIFDNSTMERFLEIQVEISKIKTFEIKIFLKFEFSVSFENFCFENNQLYGILQTLL